MIGDADSPPSDYCEFVPLLPLRKNLLCIWTQSIAGGQSVYEHRVLPDACIDIVFINDNPPVIVGPWTESFIARLAPGTAIVGARFHPGCAPAVLGLPASELINQSVPLNSVWRNVDGEFTQIGDQVSLAGRRAALERALIRHGDQGLPVDRLVSAAIRWLARHPSGRVEQLTQQFGISARQLQRRFSAAVGYGPKMFQTVLRFQRLLSLTGGKTTQESLAQLSVEAGYSDQPHMTREVQRFSGNPPSALLRSRDSTLALSDLFETE